MKPFLKNNKLIFIVTGICLLINSFFSYHQGFQREFLANKAYLDFISNYPASIQSVRVEPLFVIISVYLAKLSSPLISIIVLKLIITGLQLFIFYKLLKFLTNNNLISLLFTVILNFSFTFFSLQDNLLRNHFANTFFLLAFYLLLLTIRNTNETLSLFKNKYLLSTSFFGGLLIYSHIVPTLLFDLTLLIVFIIFTLLLILSIHYNKNILINKKSLIRTTKNILLIGLLTLIIQLPYIIKLKKANVSTTDYKVAAEIIKTDTSPLSTSITTSNTNTKYSIKDTTTIKNNKKNIHKNIHKNLLKIFRILFEFRLPGVSLLFTFLLAFSFIYFIKNISYLHIPILVLWLTTYFGTKADLLFNLGVISYRFSLMLIFSSLILLAMMLNILVSFIKNKIGKFLFVVVVLFSFLSINLPLIVSTTILRNYTPNRQQAQLLKNVYHQLTTKTTRKSLVFAVNGLSFETFDRNSKYLRNDIFFTSFDEKRIIDSYNTSHVDFIIFDHFKIQSKGSDLNTTVNTNLEFYEKSRYFDKIDEIINPYMHLSIFKYNPSGNVHKNHFVTQRIDCLKDKNCQNNFNKNIAPNNLHNWIIEISELNNNIIITESIKTENSITSLSYYQEIPPSHNIRKTTLLNIKDRRNKQVPVIIHIPKAKLLIKHKGFIIDRKELQKEDVNKLILFGKINSNSIYYSYINTTELKILISLLCIIIILLSFTVSIILLKKFNPSQSLMEFSNTKTKKLIISLIVCMLLDMLFFNILFTHLYKSLLHL